MQKPRDREYENLVERIQMAKNMKDFKDITNMMGLEIETADSFGQKSDNFMKLANLYKGLHEKYEIVKGGAF
jgi:hypothetical protein